MKQQRRDLGAVVRDIQSNVGNHVTITKNLGRNRYDVLEGTITNIYPCLFTVKLEGGDNVVKTASYNYADVFTREIQLKFG